MRLAQRAFIVAAIAGLAAAATTTAPAVAANTNRAATAFPGSNGKIAFQSNRDHFDNPALFEIYVMNGDGSDQTRLTFSGGAMPAWSPDGQKIAFSRSDPNGGGIWVMNADGSDQTQLTGPRLQTTSPQPGRPMDRRSRSPGSAGATTTSG